MLRAMSDIQNPGPDFSGAGPVEYRPAEAAPGAGLEGVRARAEVLLLAIPGVTFVGIGHGPVGGQALAVGVLDASVAARLPREIDGVALLVTITGPVDALRRR
jgi:hypothetical protein